MQAARAIPLVEHNSRAMSNTLASLLKSEFSRLARKEIRAETSSLKKASAQHRSTIAALRREVEALKRQLKAKNRSERMQAVDEEATPRHRFRRDGLATHRKTLGLSAADYGRLIGVSSQTIYKWEGAKSRPRSTQLEALAGVRGLGKREAAQRLEQLATEAAQPAGKRARKRG